MTLCIKTFMGILIRQNDEFDFFFLLLLLFYHISGVCVVTCEQFIFVTLIREKVLRFWFMVLRDPGGIVLSW